jgi:hypothetical protein
MSCRPALGLNLASRGHGGKDGAIAATMPGKPADIAAKWPWDAAQTPESGAIKVSSVERPASLRLTVPFQITAAFDGRFHHSSRAVC